MTIQVQLHSYFNQLAPSNCQLLLVEDKAQDYPKAIAQAKGSGLHSGLIIILSTESLAVIPFIDDIEYTIEMVALLSDDFDTFCRFSRQWQANAKLIIQLQRMILLFCQQAQNQTLSADHLYLFINGEFSKKYYPPAITDRSSLGLGLSDSSLREHNPKVVTMEQAFGPDSISNLLLHVDHKAGMTSCFNPKNNMLGIGRGSTQQQMLRGSIYEYLERAASFYRPQSTIVKSFNALDQQALTPGQIFGVPQNDCHKELFPDFSVENSVDWLPAKLLVSNQKKLIPAALVNYMRDSEQNISYNKNSNGCAIGNSFEEASLFALLEVIERDALLLTWYTASTPPQISLDQDIPEDIKALVLLLEIRGYKVSCFDITNDLAIPTVLVVLRGQNRENLAAFVTAASHLNEATALENALAEADSLVSLCQRNFFTKVKDTTVQSSNVITDSREAQYFHYGYPANLWKLDFLFASNGTEKNPKKSKNQLSYSEFTTSTIWPVDNVKDALSAMLKQLGKLNYECISCDNTPQYITNIGLNWVRVYVPSLINLVFGDVPIFVSKARVSQAHLAKSWINDVVVSSHPTLHPLG